MSTLSNDQRSLSLANDVEMPTVFFGCAFGDWTGATDFQGFLPEQAWPALHDALDAGYRAFDGAHAYGTESILGTLLGQRFAQHGLQRDELFITTKLAHPAAPPHVNISHLRTWDADKVDSPQQRVLDDFMRTLDDLRMGYVDLLLMHWPGPFENRDAAFARAARRTIWETFVALYQRGAARAIGVSNFTAEHIAQLIEDAPEVHPMVNQVEVHPYCRDLALEDWCRRHNIAVTAYAPFASGAFGLLRDPALTTIAEHHGVSVGQVILRWHLQQERSVLPKSSSAKRMRQNLDLFSFALDDAQMTAIDGLAGKDGPRRTCPDPSTIL